MSVTETSPRVTARRQLRVEHHASRTTWEAYELDHGRAFILSVSSAGTSFSAHFDAEQWLAFQGLVSALVSTGAER